MIIKGLLFFTMTLFGIFANDCDPPHNNTTETENKNTIPRIFDYGEGVYYFDHIERDFAEKLSNFLKEHPELEVSSLASDTKVAHGHGGVRGYYVIFKPKICK